MFWRLCILVFCVAQSRGAGAQNANLSGGFVFDGEPYLAVNPNQPNHLVVAWMGFSLGEQIVIHTRTSLDAGLTWSEPVLAPHTMSGHTSADPVLVFDSEETVWLCYIDYNPDGSSGAVVVRASEDGGLSWGPAVEAISVEDDPGEFPVDRPWMAIDQTGGPYEGYIYITTKPAPWEPIPNTSYLVRSTDGGESFENWVYTDAPGYSVGPFIASPMACPAVGPDGTFYIMYPAYEPTENLLPRFVLARSTDGGATFTYSQAYASAETVSDTLPKRGYSLHVSPYHDTHIAFIYMNEVAGDLDVVLLLSTDGGDTWTGPERIHQDTPGNGNLQDLAWAAWKSDGSLAVSWRDRRYSGLPGYEQSSEIYTRIRKPDGSWLDEVVLSTEVAAHADILNENGNDFMGCAWSQDTLLAVWGDVRTGTLQIWLARYQASTGVQLTALTAASGSSLYPNPAQQVITFTATEMVSWYLYDVQGRHCLTTAAGTEVRADISALKAGKYLAISSRGEHLSFVKQAGF